MVTKNNLKKSLNASIKEVTTAIHNQATQKLSKNQKITPSPDPILKKRLAALQKLRNKLNNNNTPSPSPMNYSMQKHSMQTRSKSKSKSSGSRRSSVGSASTHSMQTRSKSKSSGSRHSSVGSASTPLTKRQKQMLSEAKRLGFPRPNNSQLRRNKLALRFIINEKGEERVRVGQEAKNAQGAMNLRGFSRRLASELGVISPFKGRNLYNNFQTVNKSPKSKGSAKKPKSKGSAKKQKGM